MNVIISNKYQSLLASLNIDVIKSINGEFTVEELVNQFQSFYFNKMIIDITAIKNYENINIMQSLSVNFDMTKVILLLDDSEKVNERERTGNAYNLDEYDELRAIGFYQMPTLERIDYIPDYLVGFNYVLNSDRYESGVHFYIDDYQFERIWASPQMYVDKLAQFDCILTPDFSLYMDMPMAMKIWNVYRSRLIGQIYQDRGLRVIPTVSWAEPETFTFCFDGIPSNSTISVSTIGVKRSKEATKIWTQGMDEAMKRLKPKNVLVYGGDIGYDFKGANVKYYYNHVTEKMKNLKSI